jgi:hypothetical protein
MSNALSMSLCKSLSSFVFETSKANFGFKKNKCSKSNN